MKLEIMQKEEQTRKELEAREKELQLRQVDSEQKRQKKEIFK